MAMTDGDRPHFLPEDFNYDGLPPYVRQAMCELVEPAYEELVEGADSALERAAGASYTFLLLLEVLGQFNLTKELNTSLQQSRGCRSLQDEDVARHLRLAGAKDRVGGFLLRLRTWRAKYGQKGASTEE